MGRLDGKVAVITGATSGIGLRTAELFVAEGAKIVIAGRRAPEGEALAKQLGATCIFRQTDVTVEAQMKALIALSVEKFGRIDCLFNNAGGPAQTGGIEGLEVERFDAAMATLVRSVMLGMKHAAPSYAEAGFRQHHQQWQHRRPPRRLFVVDGLWRGQGRRHPSHQMRGHGARRSPTSASIRFRPARSRPAFSARRWACRRRPPKRRRLSCARSTNRPSRSRAPACPRISRMPRCSWRATNPPLSTATTSWSTAPSPAAATGPSSSRAMSR